MKIAFVADVMLGRTVNEILKQAPPSYIWGDTLSILKSADYNICNLECVISDLGEPWPDKTFHFRTDPKNVEVLNMVNFSPISIANNHSLDFGVKALERMLKILKENSINYAGAGPDIVEASMPALEDGEKNYLGMIAFTDNEPDWEAGENRPGVFYVPTDLGDPRAKSLLNLVRKTKNEVSILVVSVHWGSNWGYEPPKEHIEFAHALIDKGADIIYGHSAHVFRGIEIYKGKPILYSTGDFVDDYAVDEIERNDQSFIFIVEQKGQNFSLTLYPTVIREYQAQLAKGLEAEEIALKMQKLCSSLQTKSNWDSKRKVLQI